MEEIANRRRQVVRWVGVALEGLSQDVARFLFHRETASGGTHAKPSLDGRGEVSNRDAAHANNDCNAITATSNPPDLR
jgi:hypothetical protein